RSARTERGSARGRGPPPRARPHLAHSAPPAPLRHSALLAPQLRAQSGGRGTNGVTGDFPRNASGLGDGIPLATPTTAARAAPAPPPEGARLAKARTPRRRRHSRSPGPGSPTGAPAASARAAAPAGRPPTPP